ncbi:MAG: DUF2225 domain-containing protein [Halobacteriota archaeon]
MTLPIPISLTCPCCHTKFESLDVMISSTCGSSTDLRPIAGGSDPTYMIIHTCPSCGYTGYHYTGYHDAFKRKRLDPALREHIREQITPLIKDFSVTPKLPYEFVAPERQYEFAAWIAQWKGDSLQSIGDLYLRAAWCCNDSKDPRKERFYRLKALEYFERAMELKEISESDIGGYTYLIGELHRRVGEIGAANVWFNRVVEATNGDPEQQWLVDLAIQQKTRPKQFIGRD